MAIIRIAAPAKLNLFLHVTGRRSDGYHLLESLVAFTEFGDMLTIEPAETLTLDMTGLGAASLQQNSQDNLVMKAAHLLQAYSGHRAGAHITLQKHIPVGAGLGGGSADAAAVLSGLKTLWRIDIDDAGMAELALQLGSDVPVCLASKTAWVSGIGEQIILIPSPIGGRLGGGRNKVKPSQVSPHPNPPPNGEGILNLWAVLVNPGMKLLTKDVFRHFSGEFSSPSLAPDVIASRDALLSILKPKHNALEPPAMKLMPVIGEVLAAIRATPGCGLSRMSGSGATCFGLYDNELAAQQAAREIQRLHPAWWRMVTKIYETQ